VRGVTVLAAIAAAIPLIANAQPTDVTYDVPAPQSHDRLPDGWGLYATMQGRSMDLSSNDHAWTQDPRVQSHDVEAGYGWRSGGTSAVIGYDQHDYAPKYQAAIGRGGWRDPNAPPVPGDSGVLGFSLTMHGP
jgi:hypothetical protein